MSTRYVYRGWFRDLSTTPDDQDYEWPACFVIVATSAEEALHWGDHLSKSFSKRRGTEVFLWGAVEDVTVAEGDISSLPVVPAGYEATDSDIGW
jgi:hypothetical protein